MSLKFKLFVIFGALMVSLMITHGVIVQHLAGRTVEQYGNSMLDVSRRLASAMTRHFLLPDDSATVQPPEPVQDQRRVVKTLEAASESTDDESVQRELQTEQVSVLAIRKWRAEDAPQSLSEATAEGFRVHMELENSLHRTGDSKLDIADGSGFVLKIHGPGMEDRIEVSTTSLQESIAGLSIQLLYGTLVVLVIGLGAVALVADRVSQPLRELSQAAARVARGDRRVRVVPRGSQEVHAAMASFNVMSERITDFEETQQQWQQQRHLSELGEIARGLAHTIRNPLNTIGLSIEELAQHADQGDPDVLTLVQSSRTQIRQIDEWIRSFLSLASQEGGYLEPVDIRPLIEDIVLEVAQSGSCRVEIGESLERRIPPVHGVATEIRAMIQALVANAAEAAGSKGTVTIEVRETADKAGIETIVADNGPGLPDVVREQLYSPHVTTKVTGSGMGIYLTQRIASNRYRGSLELTDNQPTGTLARLRLSLERDS